MFVRSFIYTFLIADLNIRKKKEENREDKINNKTPCVFINKCLYGCTIYGNVINVFMQNTLYGLNT